MQSGLGLNLGFHGKRSAAVSAMPDLTLETNDKGYPLPAYSCWTPLEP